jgi:hypothetical protein
MRGAWGIALLKKEWPPKSLHFRVNSLPFREPLLQVGFIMKAASEHSQGAEQLRRLSSRACAKGHLPSNFNTAFSRAAKPHQPAPAAHAPIKELPLRKKASNWGQSPTGSL